MKDWSLDNADITSPNADSDLLIDIASFSCSAPAPVLAALSLPAKSTKLSYGYK